MHQRAREKESHIWAKQLIARMWKNARMRKNARMCKNTRMCENWTHASARTERTYERKTHACAKHARMCKIRTYVRNARMCEIRTYVRNKIDWLISVVSPPLDQLWAFRRDFEHTPQGGLYCFLSMIFRCKLVPDILKRRPAPGDTPYRKVLIRWGSHPGDNVPLQYFIY